MTEATTVKDLHSMSNQELVEFIKKNPNLQYVPGASTPVCCVNIPATIADAIDVMASRLLGDYPDLGEPHHFAALCELTKEYCDRTGQTPQQVADTLVENLESPPEVESSVEVHVVAFAPIDGKATVGGFEWFTSSVMAMDFLQKQWGGDIDNSHVYTLFGVAVPSHVSVLTRGDVEEYIRSEHSDLLP